MKKLPEVDLLAVYQRQEKSEIRYFRNSATEIEEKNYAGIMEDIDKFKDYIDGKREESWFDIDIGGGITHFYFLYEKRKLLGEAQADEMMASMARYALSFMSVAACLKTLDVAKPPDAYSKYFCWIALADRREDLRFAYQLFRREIDAGLFADELDPEDRQEWRLPLFALVMLLLADFFDLPMDRVRFAFPAEDWMPAYYAALADWRSPDLTRIQDIVQAMCDFHIRNTRKNLTPFVDLAFETDFIFPFEVLLLLRLREWIGLPNPTHYDHPMMNNPLAVLPQGLPPPATPVLDQALRVFQRNHPECQDLFTWMSPSAGGGTPGDL
jgi:hypothetical protein